MGGYSPEPDIGNSGCPSTLEGSEGKLLESKKKRRIPQGRTTEVHQLVRRKGLVLNLYQTPDLRKKKT